MKTKHYKPRPKPKATTPIISEIMDLIDNSGLLIEEIAKPSGISATTIRNWRTNRFNPTINSFRAVAEVLGYEVILRKKSDV